MRPTTRIPRAAALCWLAAAPALLAQVLEVQVQQAPAPSVVAADGGGFVISSSAVGTAAEAGVMLRNTSLAQLSINSLVLNGSSEFSLRQGPETPFLLGPGQNASFRVRFVPASPARAATRLSIAYTDGPRNAVFNLQFTGTAPDPVVSYVLQPLGNMTLLPSGGRVVFPGTVAGTTATGTIVVSNRGSGPGAVRSVAASGDDFHAAGLPLFPASLDAGRELRFNVVFSPRRIGPAQGRLEIGLETGAQQFVLEGAGIGSAFRYDLVTESGAAAIRPDQPVVLPGTAVGEKTTVRVRVSNQGNAEGRVAAINVSGTGFQLADLPFLPVVLPPGGTTAFNLVFSATQPGAETGRLRIGDDSFELQANGLGSALVFSYRAGAASVPIAPNGTIVFNPLAVGRTASAILVASNRGTAAAAISTVGVGGASSFSLAAPPELPLGIEPGASLEIAVAFAPTSVGAVAGSLRLDNYSFTLSGVGAAPRALPVYRFEGFRAEEAPMQQLSAGLTLAEPYELPVTGSLAVEHRSEVFSADPAVQFATGGKTVAFTIPAGATRAVFQNQSESVRFQTGSVAGTISLRPVFSAGQGIDVTPAAAAPTTIQVAAIPPKVLSASAVSRTAAGFTLQITGFSSTRAVSSMEFEFTAAPGVALSAAKASVNVESAFLVWYQSQQSQQYGSLFSVSIPFTFQGSVPTGQTMADAIRSVTITMSNPAGASEPAVVEMK